MKINMSDQIIIDVLPLACNQHITSIKSITALVKTAIHPLTYIYPAMSLVLSLPTDSRMVHSTAQSSGARFGRSAAFKMGLKHCKLDFLDWAKEKSNNI